MSGGHWNYINDTLQNEIFNYPYDNKRNTNPLEDVEISQLVFDIFDLLHSYDWYVSGDTTEEDYLKDKGEFKRKWLRNKNYNEEVLKELIEEELENKKQEILKML